MEQITSSITHCTARLLSHAIRLCLVKSILEGIESYWGQIFNLPKKILLEVVSICRTFLWTRSDMASRKAPISWIVMCLPYRYGALGSKNFMVWNRAVIK